jgi:hypothetical protein
MDYVARLYQNKAIQLQEQINLLEKRLKQLAEAPAWSPSSGGPAVPESGAGNNELKDRMRNIKQSGDRPQSKEYLEMEAELNRRTGGGSPAQSSSASAPRSAPANEVVTTKAAPESRRPVTSAQPAPTVRRSPGSNPGVDITQQSPDQIAAMNDPARGGQSGRFGGDKKAVAPSQSQTPSTTAAPKSGKSSISVDASGFHAPWVGKPQSTPAPQATPASPAPQSTRQTPDTLDLVNQRPKQDSGLQGTLNKGFGLDWLGTPSAKPEPTPPAPDWFTGAQDFRNRFKNPGTANDSGVTPPSSQPTGEAPVSRTEPTRITPPITTTGVSPEEFESQLRGTGETPKAKATNPKVLPYQPILFDVREIGKLNSWDSRQAWNNADQARAKAARDRDAAASTPVNQPGTAYQAERDAFRARQIEQQRVNNTVNKLMPSFTKPNSVSPAPRRTPR